MTAGSVTTLVQATEVTALIIGVGGAGAVIYKGASMLRRFGHFIDKLTGNADGGEPGIFKRLDELKTTVDGLTHGQVTLTQGADERNRQIRDLTTAVNTMGSKIDGHVDGDVPTWKAEGEAWGHRLDDQVASLNDRVTRLERTTQGDDPVTRPDIT